MYTSVEITLNGKSGEPLSFRYDYDNEIVAQIILPQRGTLCREGAPLYSFLFQGRFGKFHRRVTVFYAAVSIV